MIGNKVWQQSKMLNNLSNNLSNNLQQPDFILFAQHGWADTSRDIAYLARSLTKSSNPTRNPTYTPDLGLMNTWLTIAPLVAKVENIAIKAIAINPDLPIRIVGHSMGGLIWLEVLNRHPEWLSKVHSLILLGSPVGGSDLARLFDPFGWLPLMARDLGKNRRPIAEAIAARVPTASIVGNIGNNTDGTVPIGCSQFAQANFICLDGLRHATLKNHPQIVAAIFQFWANPAIAPPQTDLASQLIAKLRSLDLTETNTPNSSRWQYAKVIKTYTDGTKLWTWTNQLRVTHVFVTTASDRCIYSAYTMGWNNKKTGLRFSD